MGDQGFPNSHTTTTTVTVTQTTQKSDIFWDPSYIRTKFGMLKCAQIATSILGFICILSTIFRYDSRGTYYNSIAMGGFWYSTFILIFYCFHIPEKLRIIPWVKIDLVFCALWAIFFLIASSLCADWGIVEAFAAAAFFGFCATILYAINAYFAYLHVKGLNTI